MTPEGIVTLQSPFDHARTVERLIAAIQRSGLSVLCQIDHAAGARAVGLELRPSHVVLFGSARAGTPLMRTNRLVALDLPLRMLVSEDAVSRTWLSHPDPRWIAQRYGLLDEGETVVVAMTDVLNKISLDVIAARAT